MGTDGAVVISKATGARLIRPNGAAVVFDGGPCACCQSQPNCINTVIDGVTIATINHITTIQSVNSGIPKGRFEISASTTLWGNGLANSVWNRVPDEFNASYANKTLSCAPDPSFNGLVSGVGFVGSDNPSTPIGGVNSSISIFCDPVNNPPNFVDLRLVINAFDAQCASLGSLRMATLELVSGTTLPAGSDIIVVNSISVQWPDASEQPSLRRLIVDYDYSQTQLSASDGGTKWTHQGTIAIVGLA